MVDIIGEQVSSDEVVSWSGFATVRTQVKDVHAALSKNKTRRHPNTMKKARCENEPRTSPDLKT